MKILKTVVTTLGLVLLLGANAFAQVDQAFNATAEVLAALTVAEEQQTNFGVVADDFSGGNPFLDPADGTTANLEGGTPQVGFISVSGTSGQTVDVTVAGDFDITDGTDLITVDPLYNYTNDNLTAAGAPTNPVITNTDANFTMTLDTDGINTVLIGGTLLHNTAAPINSGTYTGSATLTLAYP